MSGDGLKRFSFLQPGKRAVSVWKEWRGIGHYLYHKFHLPDEASPALIASEEIRVAEIVEKLKR